MKPGGLHVVMTTAPDTPTAERLAETLVAEGLAACVQIVPGMTSFYVWQGEPERSEELLLLAKTVHPRDCLARIEALHPYETPEGVALPVTEGLAAYLRWAGAAEG